MDQDFTTLIIFTMLSQTAAGALMLREILLISSPEGNISPVSGRRSLAVILTILVAALSISFLHLGNPAHAIKSINNFKDSWLSREILFLSLLTLSLVVYYIIERSAFHNAAKRTMSIISLLLSVLFIYSMIRLYMLPSVRSWYNPGTPVSFILCVIICGFALIPAMKMTSTGTAYKRIYFLILATVIFSVVNSLIHYHHIAGSHILLFMFRFILPVIAVILIPILNLRQLLNKNSSWPVILFVLLFASELLNRIIFFLSFEKSGL